MTHVNEGCGQVCACVLSCVPLCVTPGMGACQVPLSMGLSQQEYGSRVPFPAPGDLPDPGIEPSSLRSPALAGRFFTTSTTVTREAPVFWTPSSSQISEVDSNGLFITSTALPSGGAQEKKEQNL